MTWLLILPKDTEHFSLVNRKSAVQFPIPYIVHDARMVTGGDTKIFESGSLAAEIL